MQKSAMLGVMAVIVVVIVVAGVYVITLPPAQVVTTTSPTTTTTSTTTTPEKLVTFGVIYQTPVSQSWSGAQHRAFQALKDAGKIDYAYVESVEVADGTRVGEELISSMNADVVVYTSWYPDSIKAIVEKYPDIMVVGAGGGVFITDIYGSDPAPANYAHYAFVANQGGYILGVIAARLSQTGKMGMVGAYPVPSYCDPMNGLIDGLISVNPDAKVAVSWLNTWEDPEQAKQSAAAMIDSGADVIFAGLYGAEKAVDEHPGNYAIGFYVDTISAAPEGVIGSIVWNPTWVYEDIAEAVKSGDFKNIEYNCTLEKGAIKAVLNESILSQSLIDEANDIEQKILAGTIVPNNSIDVPENVFPNNVL